MMGCFIWLLLSLPNLEYITKTVDDYGSKTPKTRQQKTGFLYRSQYPVSRPTQKPGFSGLFSIESYSHTVSVESTVREMNHDEPVQRR